MKEAPATPIAGASKPTMRGYARWA